MNKYITQTDEQVGKILRLSDELGEHNCGLEFLRLCKTFTESQNLITELEERIANKEKSNKGADVQAMNMVIVSEKLKEIIELCGTVNFSSHKQMREALEGSLEMAESALEIHREYMPKEITA